MSLTTKLPITVIMITLNEEYHLREVIENVKPWATELFILDSCSNDHTLDIALKQGVKIAQRKFTNFGDQWNFAIDNFPIATDWTMKLDPDERVTPELVQEMACMIESPKHSDGYSMQRRLWFMGKPLHVKQDVLRLWKTGKCQFSNVLVNEHPLIDGKIGRLKSFLEHYDSYDLKHWIDKQNVYTTMEAIMKARNDDLAARPKLMGRKLERKMFFKKCFFMVPLRYQLYWFFLMIARGAWRDGKVGRCWARCRIEVTRMIEFKTIEIQVKGSMPAIPQALHGNFDPRVLATPLQQTIMRSANWLAK